MARVHILGAGTPTPTPTRFGSAYAVEVGGEHLMFDCGPAATWKLVKMGIRPTQVDYLFFTHHHFDHDVDYPCFLLCRWDQSVGTENPLRVYGPTLTELITERLLGEQGAFAHDWQARVNAPLSQRVYVMGPDRSTSGATGASPPPRPSTCSPGWTPSPTASTPPTAASCSPGTPSPARASSSWLGGPT